MRLKDFFKERITLEVLSGGHVLTDKEVPVAISTAVLMNGDNRGEVIISIPFTDKKTWKIKGIELEESHARNVGKTAVGTIAGGLVGGVIGAGVGAAIGGRRKDTSKAFLTIADKEGNEYELHIICDMQLYRKLSGFIR